MLGAAAPPGEEPAIPRWVVVVALGAVAVGAVYLVTRRPKARRRRNPGRRNPGAAEELHEHRGRVQASRKAAAALCRRERREVDAETRADVRAAEAAADRRRRAAQRRCRIRASALTSEAKATAGELSRKARREARGERRAAEESGERAIVSRGRSRTAPIVDPWTGKAMTRERIQLLVADVQNATADASHPAAAGWYFARPGVARDVIARTAASYRRRGPDFLRAHRSLDVSSAVVEGFEENREDLIAQWAEAEEQRDHGAEGARHYRAEEKTRAAQLARGAPALAGGALPADTAERRILAALRVRHHEPKVSRGRVRCTRCGAAGRLDRTRRGAVSFDGPDALRADCAGEGVPF